MYVYNRWAQVYDYLDILHLLSNPIIAKKKGGRGIRRCTICKKNPISERVGGRAGERETVSEKNRTYKKKRLDKRKKR